MPDNNDVVDVVSDFFDNLDKGNCSLKLVWVLPDKGNPGWRKSIRYSFQPQLYYSIKCLGRRLFLKRKLEKSDDEPPLS